MRLDINLASRPYEDAGQFWLRWGSGLAGISILTLGLLILTVSGWYEARRDRAAIGELQRQIGVLDAKRAKAEATLNLPENRSMREQSQLLNSLILRKAFSWTRVFEDLENVMPPRVHLVSINPELDEDNQLELKMVLGGNSRDRAIELVRRMEESRCFAQAAIQTERNVTSQSGDTEQFDVSARYIPGPLAHLAAAKESEAGKASGTSPAAKPAAKSVSLKTNALQSNPAKPKASTH